MASEATEYLLPEGLGVEAAAELLAGRLEVDGDRARAGERAYYDTFDGRLHAADLVLTHERGRLLLSDGAGHRRAAADLPGPPPHTLLCAELDPGPLRDLLQPLAKVRALTPLARVSSRVRLLRVLDDEAKTVVRLALEEPRLRGPGRRLVPLAPRVRLLPVRGYDTELAAARRTLTGDLELTPAVSSLQDEAVAAAGGTPGGVSSKLDVRVEASERADRATAVALAGPLATIRANLPGTLADTDSEFLHDLRVAVRRTRSLQRQLAPVFPPDRLPHFRAEFRRLQQVTGAVRDLDVHMVEIGEYRVTRARDDLAPLGEVLAARRAAELRRMTRALRARRTGELLDGWEAVISELSAAGGEAPQAAAPVAAVAGARIASVYRRIAKMGRRIDTSSPPEALHELRKKGKELRYLLEFFRTAYPAEVVDPIVRSLKVLQDALGRYQDREVQAGMLRSLREEVGALDGGAAALMAMGLLVDGLEREQAGARAQFAERFAPFASKRRLALVEESFR